MVRTRSRKALIFLGAWIVVLGATVAVTYGLRSGRTSGAVVKKAPPNRRDLDYDQAFLGKVDEIVAQRRERLRPCRKLVFRDAMSAAVPADVRADGKSNISIDVLFDLREVSSEEESLSGGEGESRFELSAKSVSLADASVVVAADTAKCLQQGLAGMTIVGFDAAPDARQVKYPLCFSPKKDGT